MASRCAEPTAPSGQDEEQHPNRERAEGDRHAIRIEACGKEAFEVTDEVHGHSL
jgi:hypothetical protein